MHRSLEPEEWTRLIDTATGKIPPTAVMIGGRILNVFTGDLEEKDVALAGSRIAYVGSLEQGGIRPGEETRVMDVKGKVLVPGYIEPHAHPFQLYNPVSLAEKVLPLGTTAAICDNLFFFTNLPMEEQGRLMDELGRLPMKMYWWARWDPQSHPGEDEPSPFTYERVQSVMSHPGVLQGGELTDWVSLLSGDERMVRWMRDAKTRGIRVEGHAPGASYRTLARLAAAGVTGDHESISVEEVWRRLELGYMTTLRHSSLRPDLPLLMAGLMREPEKVPWHRLMMTTDGPTPSYLREGFVDFLLKVAMKAGCDPVRAYQMVTINPAQYYRLDDHLGAVAPGRVADINVLESLENPVPVQVITDGRTVAEKGKLCVPMPGADRLPLGKIRRNRSWRVEPKHLLFPAAEGEPVPVIRLINPVITQFSKENLPVEQGKAVIPPGDERLFVVLADLEGGWITRAVIRGFARNLDGLATTYNGSGDLLIFGRDPESMSRAANRALEQGGGITWVQQGEEVYNLPLPLGGKMSLLPVDALIQRTDELKRRLQEYGHPFHDPVYTFLFLSSTHLPQVRLTANGLLRVKDRTILQPSEKRRG